MIYTIIVTAPPIRSMANIDLDKRQQELRAAFDIQKNIHDIMNASLPQGKETKALLSHSDHAINGLLHADCKEIFNAQRTYLDHLIQNLQKYAQQDRIDALRQQQKKLNDARLSYLTSKSGRLLNFLKTGWISLDIGLLAASIIFGFAYTNLGLGIPILVLTFFSLGYNAVDLYLKGERQIKTSGHAQDIILIKRLAQDFPTLDVNQWASIQDQDSQQWRQEQGLLKKLGLGLGIIGLICSVGSVLFLFPSMTIPMAANLAATVINASIVLGFIGILAFKMNRIHNVIKKNQIKITEKIKVDQSLFNQISSKNPQPSSSPKDSTRKMIDQHVGSSHTPHTTAPPISKKSVKHILGRLFKGRNNKGAQPSNNKTQGPPQDHP